MAEEEVDARCPRCGVKVRWKDSPFRPFCSLRCKLIDLGGWVDERYRIEGEKTDNVDYQEGGVEE